MIEQLIRVEAKENAPHAKTPPIMHALHSNLMVIKISGKCHVLPELAERIKAAVDSGKKVVIVHGAGVQIDKALHDAGITTVKENGVRITPPEAMSIIAQEVEALNKLICGTMADKSLKAVQAGIGSGPYIINGERKIGRTGEVASVDVETLKFLLKDNDVVVLSCLGIDADGLLNINADSVAAGVAVAMKAGTLKVVSDKAVMANGSTLAAIDGPSAEDLISQGIITDGMVVKVKSMLNAASHVEDVLIEDESGRTTRFISPES